MRNRRWLGATALGLLGWPLEIAALLLAPLTVVQPCLASGLILLLWLGATRLGEAPGRRELVAVAAIVVGVAGVAWAAPERTTDHAGTAAIALALVLVAIPVAAPYVLQHARLRRRSGSLPVISAGFGYAWTAIASKLLTDELAAGAAAGRARLAGDRSRLRGAGAAQRDERSAAAAGDPCGAGDVRRPGSGAGDAGAADLRRVVVAHPARRSASWSPSWPSRVAGTILLAGSRAVGARDRDRPRGRVISESVWDLIRFRC